MRTTFLSTMLLVLSAAPLSRAAESTAVLEVGKFSAASEADSSPPGWEPLIFKKIPRATTYSLARDGNTLVVKADSQASASGLVRKIRFDPRQYPVVEWRWKVTNLIAKADVRKKAGDDYPARIYITFEYDSARVGFFEKAKFETGKLLYGEYPPIGAINYVWDTRSPRGTIVPNAFTDRVKMIVVESGEEGVGRWLGERRNVLEDYRKAFGDDPPAISGVAIMTDTDNTGEAATAFYGDIVFRKQ